MRRGKCDRAALRVSANRGHGSDLIISGHSAIQLKSRAESKPAESWTTLRFHCTPAAGKATFANGFKGGVHVVKPAKEAREVASKMLGQTLVTHRTGPTGRVVNKVLIGKSAEIAREIYFAILLDRASAAPLIVASTEGGVEIEAVAAK